MNQIMTTQEIALKQLKLHPQNVRANAPETYEADRIAHLKASIASMGLIAPLVVQKQKGGFGVLAGGRRLAAMNALVQDKAKELKAWSGATKIACRVLPEDCDVNTAISLAENITQQQMAPIDEFEAFAQMMESDGQTPETIAMTFGTTIAAVKERLRYGTIHPEIRDAARKREISLDAMKAFAGHPCQTAQFETFSGLVAGNAYMNAHAIKQALNERGIRAEDALGAFVIEEYKRRDGPIARDLLDEDGVLEDRALADKIMVSQLEAIAEQARQDGGFAWAEIMPKHDYQALFDYGRIYEKPIEVDDQTQAEIDKLTDEGAKLEEQIEAGDLTDDETYTIEDRMEELAEEINDLQTGYDPEDLKKAGLIVSWQNGVTITRGLVRPSDKKSAKAGDRSADDDNTITYAAKFADDLKTERSTALGAALAYHPDTATDLALFKLVCDVMLHQGSVTHAFKVNASKHYPEHAKADEIDTTAKGKLEKAYDLLETSWLEKDIPVDKVRHSIRTTNHHRASQRTASQEGA